jgi:4-diphosphocytidyl-2-C-methyl-D-erythritol kinase
MITTRAYAKVNLGLEVLNKRSDGYHEILTILQTIDLYDTLIFETASEIVFTSDSIGLNSSDNLVVQAANLLKSAGGVTRGASICLNKKIPISSGLGGGSSDAAATLKGLTQLWGLKLSIEDLLQIAVQIGSDVPFFLHGGTAIASGRGESIRLLPAAELKWMVLLNPPFDVINKTASMYSMLHKSHFSQGNLIRDLENKIRQYKSIDSQSIFNVFEQICFQMSPELKIYWQHFHDSGATNIHLAGSGLSLFTLVGFREEGKLIKSVLESDFGLESSIVSFIQPRECVE